MKIIQSFMIWSLAILLAAGDFAVPCAWADGSQAPIAQDASGTWVPVVRLEDLPEPARNTFVDLPPATLEDFFDPNPLSPVIIQSQDPFYSSAGSWGQNYDDLWWHKRVEAEKAWAYARGEGVTIAVIDTGLDLTHPDIADNVWQNEKEKNGQSGVDDDANGFVDDINGWDFYNRDANPTDDQGHGSHVSGIAAAAADNQLGIAGIAPESKILPVKALNSSGSGFIRDIAAGVRYAVDLGAKVINMSLGAWKSLLSATSRKAMEDAVAYALEHGAMVVTSAGNSDTDASEFYPGAVEGVINVSALEPVTDALAWFSNYGDIIDVAAPGVDVLSLRASGTNFGNPVPDVTGYARASGTSMAAPVVAGVIALMLSWDPGLKYADIVRRLHFSAVDLGVTGFDPAFGYGLVNAFAAVSRDYYKAGQLKTQWLAVPDADGFVHYEYNLDGLIIQKTSPSNDYVLVDYWGNGTVRMREEFHDRYTIWLKTVDYYDDGLTVYREFYPNGNFYEYDREGNLIVGAESNGVVFPAIQGTPPTQLFLRRQAEQFAASIASEAVHVANLPAGDSLGFLQPIGLEPPRLVPAGAFSQPLHFAIGASAFHEATGIRKPLPEESEDILFIQREPHAQTLVRFQTTGQEALEAGNPFPELAQEWEAVRVQAMEAALTEAQALWLAEYPES